MTQIKSNDKLYVITRKDLDPGYQGVQSLHALQEFVMQHPIINKEWYSKSNYLGWLAVKDEGELVRLIEKADQQGIAFSVFREPDIDNEITAIALEPGEKSRRLCSNLPLSLKETGNNK